jgi:hypothetical protein
MTARGNAAAPSSGAATPVCSSTPDDVPQLLPAAAYDGKETYLIVWQQGRKYFEGDDAKILAARISSTGELLDEQPIAIAKSQGSQECPKVVFAGGLFFIVWQDFRNGRDWDVYGARVSPEGRVLDASGIELAAAAHDQALPVVAPSDDGFLVAWQDRRDGGLYEIYTTLVSAKGTVTDRGGVPLTTNNKNLRGGSLNLVRAGNDWSLAFVDDAAGFRLGTHFIGRLKLEDKRVTADDLRLAPKGMYGFDPTCLAATKNRILYLCGGSQRGARIPKGVLFDAATGEPLANPNEDSSFASGAGWADDFPILLCVPLVPGFQPPMCVAAAGENFAVLIRQRSAPVQGKDQPQPLRLLRIAADGKRLDDVSNLPIVDRGDTAAVSHPFAVAGKPGTILVAYQAEATTGSARVVCRIVNTD